MSLESIYAAIEQKTSAFSRETGIACPEGCGQCCESIDFAVSRVEADAVAAFLLDHSGALARFESRSIENPWETGRKVACPLYDADNGAAHCTVYEARPLLCRTFAFSAHREKDGQPVYSPCRRFRETPASEARVERARAGSPSLPILPDEAMSVWSLDPSARDEDRPMGPAVARALDRLRFVRQLQSSS